MVDETEFDIMDAEDLDNAQEQLTAAFGCGPRNKCPDGSEHDYSGWEEMDNGGTAVCSKCGHRAFDDAYWY